MEMKNAGYQKLALMLIISFCSMYLVMFFNVDDLDHTCLSLTRFYMSLLMVLPMALLMLWMMRDMYPNKRLNATISITAVVLFVCALMFSRLQVGVSDKQYMRAMIPHHSSAILTSKHANIKDPEVRKLADSIIASPEREIVQMKEMPKRLDN